MICFEEKRLCESQRRGKTLPMINDDFQFSKLCATNMFSRYERDTTDSQVTKTDRIRADRPSTRSAVRRGWQSTGGPVGRQAGRLQGGLHDPTSEGNGAPISAAAAVQIWKAD